VSTGEDQGQGPPKKKRKKGSSKRNRVPDREQLDDSSGFQHEEQPCGRCGKLFHKEEDCMSEFHKEGSRLGNKPPGQGPKWKPSGKKCNKCGSSEHLSFFDGCPGPRKEPAAGVLSDQEKLQRKFQQPSVRAIMMDSKGASNQLVNGEKLKCILCDSTSHPSFYCSLNPSGPNFESGQSMAGARRNSSNYYPYRPESDSDQSD
jgi:hypothetical protein